ncbi:coiled-coil domain-containing protein 117 isoform X1 [Pungitius pungitius]|uniref:coiled-coil domain-containing protein 117 isoform X1 n=1 Tax=Pungitius pungitius TaxID=134920 RepID=UPI0018886D83|nr:coiled-coil domain-containing protein 117 isoform X1 [Pungitius pungitius]XP_037338331.1 coiled-coil domain-containing protein 117 isoform X1 [Pungitius pungitius]XP_037338332.1 coiled-coil domain-containing protein 117 isoform X1 [Pungitius pungitius]
MCTSSNRMTDWIIVHRPAPTSSERGYLPAMYSFSGPTSLPEFELGSASTSGHLQRATLSNNSWETRSLRKHRRTVEDEGCTAKRRRLMFEAEVGISENSSTATRRDWSANGSPPAPAVPKPRPAPQPSSALPRPEVESSCMEVEAAQRKLQEIEDRITLEDDDEDEDLDLEPAPRRPVLVMSDSLKEGLQRGISDILPHTVAQSVSHSCMELVLWRPPDDPFCRKRKGTVQRQRKQLIVSQQPPTPCSSPTPPSASSPPADPQSSPYVFPVPHSSGVEDMEM